MRSLIIIALLFVLGPAGRAQTQEPNLVDRLLRPNMELKHNAQNKRFTAKSTVVERRGTVGTFYLQPNRSEKSFTDTRDYSSGGYSTRAFNSEAGAVATSQNRSAKVRARIDSPSVTEPRAAYDGQRSVTSREYLGQREFREKGKSQKSLDRQNPPLTIDQVRELLNKNK